MSNMKDTASALNQSIARRMRELRTGRKLSLDELAIKSGVSRSMISLVERGESSPTAVILEKLAAGLDVSLASLFESPTRSAINPVSRKADQLAWRDPSSGYVRRNVSPSGVSQPIRISEVHFPAGKRVVFESISRDTVIYQQIWVLSGQISLTVGLQKYRLCQGDCLAMRVEGTTVFHNPTRKTARYAVVIASSESARRRG